MTARGAHPLKPNAAEPAMRLADTPHVTEGMPPLQFKQLTRSFFEFWPTWLVYLPVVVQSLYLAARYRSLSLPFIANPNLTLSGMVGVAKSELLTQAQAECAESILPWFMILRDTSKPNVQAESTAKSMSDRGFHFPVVCKPDIGCRGAGVKLVENQAALSACLAVYPESAPVLIQQLSQYEPEVGIFYVREPDQAKGRIISMALKYSPYVVGDGQSTLKALLERDPRAKDLQYLYTQRHDQALNSVLPDGQPYKLVFSASHCRGAIFKNAAQYITPELEARLDVLMKGLPEFYYGRLDVKFRDIDALQKGQTLEIIEINGASSESLHIWDSDASFKEALSALLYQYRTLFRLGHLNRNRGYKTPGLSKLFELWRKERNLTRNYPETD